MPPLWGQTGGDAGAVAGSPCSGAPLTLVVAAIVLPDTLRGLSAVTDVYVDRWLSLVAEGLPPAALADAEWQDVSRRDHLNRAAMFAPRTNPVWGLLDRLVGEQAVGDMRGLLVPTS